MSYKTCEECDAKCCKHVAMEIDSPEDREDFENLRWFVSHKNVNIFVDEEGIWHLEFITPCEFLGKDNKCLNYENRPDICREYDHEECVFHGDYKEKHTFTNLKELDGYIKKNFKK